MASLGQAQAFQDLGMASQGLAWTSQGLNRACQGLARASLGLAWVPWAWFRRGWGGWTDGQTEFLPILQDFVPYRGRCPASHSVRPSVGPSIDQFAGEPIVKS